MIIIQAREKDRANYTCVAENVANRRLSPPARLNVHGMLRFFSHGIMLQKMENNAKTKLYVKVIAFPFMELGFFIRIARFFFHLEWMCLFSSL